MSFWSSNGNSNNENNNNNYNDNNYYYGNKGQQVQIQKKEKIQSQQIVYTQLLTDHLNNCFAVFDKVLNHFHQYQQQNKKPSKKQLKGWTAQCTAMANLFGSMCQDVSEEGYKEALIICSNRLKIYLEKKQKGELNIMEPLIRYLICASLDKKLPIIPAIAIDPNTFNEENVNKLMTNFMGNNHKTEDKVKRIQNESKRYKNMQQTEYKKYGKKNPKFNDTNVPSNDELFGLVGGTQNVKLYDGSKSDNIPVSQQLELVGDDEFDEEKDHLHYDDKHTNITNKEKKQLQQVTKVYVIRKNANKKLQAQIYFDPQQGNVRYQIKGCPAESISIFSMKIVHSGLELNQLPNGIIPGNFFQISGKKGEKYHFEMLDQQIAFIWVRGLNMLIKQVQSQ